jgi:hypothetical protein
MPPHANAHIACNIHVNYVSYCYITLSWNKIDTTFEHIINNIVHHKDDKYIKYYLHYKKTDDSYNDLTYNELIMDLLNRLSSLLKNKKYILISCIDQNVICKNTTDILYAITYNILDIRNKFTDHNATRKELGNEIFDRDIHLDPSYVPEFLNEKNEINDLARDMVN